MIKVICFGNLYIFGAKAILLLLCYQQDVKSEEYKMDISIGVWVLSFPTYLNCCPFFLNMLNCRSPSGDQIIFMYSNRNTSFITT